MRLRPTNPHFLSLLGQFVRPNNASAHVARLATPTGFDSTGWALEDHVVASVLLGWATLPGHDVLHLARAILANVSSAKSSAPAGRPASAHRLSTEPT